MGDLTKKTGFTVSHAQLAQWHEEFEAAARRTLAQRINCSFIKTYKPVLDNALYRSFETMAEYRQWYEENLPDWLGYDRV